MTAALVDEHGGPPPDRSRLWRLKRRGASTRAALLALGYAPDLVDAVAALWPARMESESWLAQDRALPGAARALGALRRRGHRLAVITARRRESGVGVSLRAAGLHDAVDSIWVVSPDDAAAGKARVLSDLRAHGFIGDTDSDGLAARLAQVPFVAVCTGQRSRGYLRAAGYEPAGSLPGALTVLGL